MNLATVIGTLALILVVFLAIRYIYKEKKKGTKCIGCPYAGGCESHPGSGTCTGLDVEEIRRSMDLK